MNSCDDHGCIFFDKILEGFSTNHYKVDDANTPWHTKNIHRMWSTGQSRLESGASPGCGFLVTTRMTSQPKSSFATIASWGLLEGGVRSKQSQLMLHKRPSILWQHQLITRWFFLISPTIWTKPIWWTSLQKNHQPLPYPKKTSEFSFITFFQVLPKKFSTTKNFSKHRAFHPHHPTPNSNLPISHQLHLKEIHCCLNSP